MTHEYVTEWLYDRQYAASTAANYSNILDQFTRSTSTPLADITRDELRSFLQARLSTSQNAAYKAWQALRSFYAWAAENDDYTGVQADPMARVKAPAKPPSSSASSRRVADPDDFTTFVRNTSGQHYEDVRARAMVATMFYAGLRISEVLRLDLDHVDLDDERPTLFVADSKTAAGSNRYVPVSPKLKRHLKSYLRVRVGSRDDGAPLFVGNAGTRAADGRLTSSAWNSYLRRYRARTGHQMSSAHTWRRRATVDMLDAGVNQLSIQAINGWADGRMVETYSGDQVNRLALEDYFAKTTGEREQRRVDRRRLRAV